MSSDNLLNDLEDIVNKGLEDSPIPYAKGNSIRIKQFVIRESKAGFLVYDVSTNKQVHRTPFKSVAVAIAKNLAEKRCRTDKILEIEGQLAKHYNDAVFYKNIIKKTSDDGKRTIRETRLEISLVEAQKFRNSLDKYIFA